MTTLSTAQPTSRIINSFPIFDTANNLFEQTYPVFNSFPIQEVVIVDRTKEHLKKTIRVLAEQTESGNWVVYHPVILTHGYGKTEIEAARDFHDMMIGLYIELNESEEELAPHLRRELDYLRDIIVENSV